MDKIKQYITSFFSIVLSVVILSSTSGFTIYKHHCNHKHANYYSLFTPSNKCDMHATKVVVKSCCNKSETKQVNTCNSKAEKGCCTDKTQVFKLDTKTLVNNSTVVLKPIETASILMLTGFHNITLETEQIAIQAYEFAESPPPLTVPEYLSFIQVYTI